MCFFLIHHNGSLTPRLLENSTPSTYALWSRARLLRHRQRALRDRWVRVGLGSCHIRTPRAYQRPTRTQHSGAHTTTTTHAEGRCGTTRDWREHEAEVRTAVIIPPLACAWYCVADREEKRRAGSRFERDGEGEEVPGRVERGRRRADVARLGIRDGRPVVGGEARRDGFLEGDVAHAYGAAEERGSRGEEGEGLEMDVRVGRGLWRWYRGRVCHRELFTASSTAAALGRERIVRVCLCFGVGVGAGMGDGGGPSGGVEETDGF